MWFFIGFHSISFFKRNNNFFLFTASYLLFWKIFGDMIHEKFKIQKKKKKKLRKRHYLQQQIESHFWPRKRWNLDFSISIKVVENWIFFQNTSITNQLEFWAASYGQNTKQVQKITQIQHYLQFSLKISNEDQHQIRPSLSNRLILSLRFRGKIFEK